ncbi:YdcF family protein [Cytophagaceae bacterium 50C-KIRBA]|uniref:YdcF family protein n=1 Tax=Aquirufa beregesia TaxID=2516556 RepID=A0ABX0ESM8_9BACT|nr:YdcF family protein [Aquirufa beregesia]NGZ43051.1 YdcF family protein [Aquirufa beregesia]
MDFQEVMVVLGSPNSSDGQLGPIALDRVNHCWEQFQKQARPILCTGGFGDHFNTSPWSHAALLKQDLIHKGIPEHVFLPLALSSNTVDDAVKSKVVLENFPVKSLVIITSSYHLARVQLIFDVILLKFSKLYMGIEHFTEIPELVQLKAHEAKAIHEIKSKGLYY